jgi:hypothetical protein
MICSLKWLGCVFKIVVPDLTLISFRLQPGDFLSVGCSGRPGGCGSGRKVSALIEMLSRGKARVFGGGRGLGVGAGLQTLSLSRNEPTRQEARMMPLTILTLSPRPTRGLG